MNQHNSYSFIVLAITHLLFVCVHGFYTTDARIKRELGVEQNRCPVQIAKHGMSVINRGITLLYKDIKVEGRYYKALKELYNKMKDDKEILTNIYNHLKAIYSDKYNLDTSKRWDESIAHLYTREFPNNNSVYFRLNEILRKHKCHLLHDVDRNATAFAPFSAALTAILLYGRFEAKSDNTYRKTFVSGRQPAIYQDQENKGIVLWTSFGSSSLSKDFAKSRKGNVLYTIENNENIDNMWKPKSIKDCSQFEGECEALYPPGSVFYVKSVKSLLGVYQIQLILRAADEAGSETSGCAGISTFHIALICPLIFLRAKSELV